MTNDECNRISHLSLSYIAQYLHHAFPLGGLAALYGAGECIGSIVVGVGANTQVA